MNDEASSVGFLWGLTESDAQARLKHESYNGLPRGGRRTPVRIILEAMREPMLALLAGDFGDRSNVLASLAQDGVTVLLSSNSR